MKYDGGKKSRKQVTVEWSGVARSGQSFLCLGLLRGGFGQERNLDLTPKER
jgi:hypothetical protein